MAEFRDTSTIDRKGRNTTVMTTGKQNGFVYSLQVKMPNSVFDHMISKIGKNRYGITNLKMVSPSIYGDAREYRGDYKGYKIIIWQKREPRGSPFFITIKKGRQETHIIADTLASSLDDSVKLIDSAKRRRERLVSS